MTDSTRAPLELAWTAPRSAPADAWPHPTTERWQPLRLGLVDLFYYDDEQFWFHDGRLLLRGNNGTGKSKVLALTLPFLLDGSLLPRRVEPDADPKKRMEWNLLLGGAHPSTERTGYAWVEFGRLDADGLEHFTTLGIGLKAASGRGIVKTWYFITPRRVGDLRLVDAHRVALTQERLRDDLVAAGAGQVFTTQEAYRRAVDEALFRLGEERYAALIDLLIQLRQPQLSKKPDEKALSAALTEALTPLDQAVVADVAESFRSLEEERAGIADAKDTLGAAEEFLKHYRFYAKVAARRHTTAVREANSAYEWAGRNLREAETARDVAVEEVEQLRVAQTGATERRSGLEGEKEALRESPEMRDATLLAQAERAANGIERRAVDARGEAETARAASERDGRRAAEAGSRYDDVAAEALRCVERATRLAEPAGLADDHAALASDDQAARRALSRRREQVAHVRALVDATSAAEALVVQRRATLDTAEGEAARRGEDVQSSEAAVEAAVEAHREDVRAYLAGLTSLVLDADDLAGLAEAWARRQAGDSPARAAVDAAVAAARDRISRERAQAHQAESQIGAELADVREQAASIEAGRDPEPPPAPGRDPQVREERLGAQLWRLTDFVEAVPDAERAGLEASLQSAGLLDAWLFPDGTVTADGDVVLGPQGPAVESSIAAVLVPAVGPDDVVPAEVVARVLGRIGLGEDSDAPLWVSTSGSWGAGPARGAWSKDRAEYVGAGAREASRRAVLAELRARIAELEREQTAARARIETADDQARQVQTEHAGYPAERELVAAHERAAAARRELDRAAQVVTRARAAWEQAREKAARSAEALADQADQLRLGSTAAALTATADAISAYAEALIEVRTTQRSLAESETTRAHATELAAEAAELKKRRESTWQDLREQATGLRAKYDALQATVGASVAELQAKLSGVETAIGEIADELKLLELRQLEAAALHGELKQKVSDLGQRREETAAEREREVSALRAFTSTGLLRVAVPELATPDPELVEEWNVTGAVGLSRVAEQHLDDTDASDEAWSRSQQRVSSASTELTSQMSRHGHTAFVEQHGDVLVARVRYLGDQVDVDRLASRLEEDVADRERLLSAREREILENHLVNEVAGHLHELLLAAEGQIDRMNRELAERRTSTGMQLRVRWRERVDGPAALAATRQLMLRSDATWTASDRTAIGDFLHAQISEVRQADPTGGWQGHLEQALDYRRWHSFSVERLQNGQWRSASGPASGGEKVLAVSVPLFAAASAHYNSADSLAPRLILLDEAFAGVDDDSRAKSLGLLATFDLDVVMTSEREWGCYPQVPGLAIAQLSRVEGVAAVGVTRWRWDGRRRQRVGEVDESARAADGAAAPLDDNTLFG